MCHSCTAVALVVVCFVLLCMMVADNKLGAEGIVALAPALSKLVALTSLDLGSTWLAMRLWVHWRVEALG